MKKIKIAFLILTCACLLFGCKKENNEVEELQILGVNTEKIKKIEIIHGNVILYQEKDQRDNLTLIENLNKALVDTSDKIEILNESLDITIADAEGYAQKDSNNYYVFITFSEPQIISFNNIDEYENCDGVLLDLNSLKLHWCVESNFVGAFGYKDITSVESDFSKFLKETENIFSTLNY